jgi:hypothetical protein
MLRDTLSKTAAAFNAPTSKTSVINKPAKAVAKVPKATTAPILNAAGPNARQVQVEFFKSMNGTQRDEINRLKQTVADLKCRAAVLSNAIYKLEFNLKFQMQQKKAIANCSETHSRSASNTQSVNGTHNYTPLYEDFFVASLFDLTPANERSLRPATAPKRSAVQKAPQQAQRPVPVPKAASTQTRPVSAQKASPKSASAPRVRPTSAKGKSAHAKSAARQANPLKRSASNMLTYPAANNTTTAFSRTTVIASKGYAHSSTALMFRKIRNYNQSNALAGGGSSRASSDGDEAYSPGYISPEMKREAEKTWEQFFKANTNSKRQHLLPMSPAQTHALGQQSTNAWVLTYAQEKFNSFKQQATKKAAPSQNKTSSAREAARNAMLAKTSVVPISYARKKMGSSTPSSIPLTLYNKHNKSSCNGYEQGFFNAAMFELPPSFLNACHPAEPIRRLAILKPASAPVQKLSSQNSASLKPAQQPNFHTVQLKKVPQSAPVSYVNVGKPAPYASAQMMKDTAPHNFGYAKSDANNGYEQDYFNAEMFALPASYLSASKPAGPVMRMAKKTMVAVPRPSSG